MSELELETDLGQDIIGISIVSIIGYKSLMDIMLTNDFPEYKESDSIDIITHLNHTFISDLIDDFLRGE